MAVEFGLVLPAGPRKGALERYLGDLDASLAQVERLFTGLWMTDHFFWEDEPTYEAWTVLAYIAARYPRFLIGPIVLSQSYRNPALLAKMGATLQHLSGGRLVMAVGAGWKEDEYRAYDYPFPALPVRLQQLHDTLEILKRLWTQPGRVTVHGTHYRVDDAYCEPKPDPLPPIIVGGGGPTTLKLAAQYADWWNLYDANWATYSARLDALRAACADVGRDFDSLRLTWFGRVALGATLDDALALSAGKWTPDNSFTGTAAQVVDLMRPFVAAGVDHFIVEVLDYANPAVLDRLAQVQSALARG